MCYSGAVWGITYTAVHRYSVSIHVHVHTCMYMYMCVYVTERAVELDVVGVGWIDETFFCILAIFLCLFKTVVQWQSVPLVD